MPGYNDPFDEFRDSETTEEETPTTKKDTATAEEGDRLIPKQFRTIGARVAAFMEIQDSILQCQKEMIAAGTDQQDSNTKPIYLRPKSEWNEKQKTIHERYKERNALKLYQLSLARNMDLLKKDFSHVVPPEFRNQVNETTINDYIFFPEQDKKNANKGRVRHSSYTPVVYKYDGNRHAKFDTYFTKMLRDRNKDYIKTSEYQIQLRAHWGQIDSSLDNEQLLVSDDNESAMKRSVSHDPDSIMVTELSKHLDKEERKLYTWSVIEQGIFFDENILAQSSKLTKTSVGNLKQMDFLSQIANVLKVPIAKLESKDENTKISQEEFWQRAARSMKISVVTFKLRQEEAVAKAQRFIDNYLQPE